MAQSKIRIGILGASGYTGAELLRLLLRHPCAQVTLMTGDRSAGKPISSVFPHLAGNDLPDLIAIADADWSRCDVVFCALPHGATQEVIAALPRSLKAIDLSADFRLYDGATYARWYGHDHRAPDLQKEAVYGLTEFTRDRVAKAFLVANPGCYPTSAQLPLIPLIEAGLIDTADIIVDAKSGASGAGRAAKESSLFCEVSEGIHAYGVAAHRHAPEIEQGLSLAAGRDVLVNFTPHLMPMNRGILSTLYVRLTDGISALAAHQRLEQRFRDEYFVKVMPFGVMPSTRHVRGSNFCHIGLAADRLPGRAIVVSAIDNLVKGAAGQAVQNMNVMCGQAEWTGLEQVAMFP